MNSDERFQPDWTSAPGDTIIDILQQRDISDVGFATLMNLPLEDTADLLQGRSTVTLTIARKLASVLGASVEFWMSRDYQYRQDARRFHEEEEGWLRRLPLGDMIRFGWLSPPPLPSEELAACLRFFGVSSFQEWKGNYASLQEMAAFRSSPSFDSRHESISAWLRQGEIKAEEIDCGPWHAERFQACLSQLRTLTRLKDPQDFIPALQTSCSEHGVAVVVVRAPGGCRASGATRFVTNDKALLQLSFRYLTDDQFWFTFFHEAGHLLLHGQKHFFRSAMEGQRAWILEGADFSLTEEEEQEASNFAVRTLIPQEFQNEISTIAPNSREIIRLARRVGISPGIIVGQLQYHRRIDYNQLNGLKRRFVWQE